MSASAVTAPGGWIPADEDGSVDKLRELLANVAASCTDAGVRFLPELEVGALLGP